MKKAIAMRCSKEQFEAIKPKLEKHYKIGLLLGAFETYPYLTNNYGDKREKIFDFVGSDSLWQKEHKNNIHEEWNEKVFLEACGIETETVLEVGKWYKMSEYKKFIGAITKIENDRFWYYGFNTGGTYIESDFYGINESLIEATQEEVFEALKNEAVMRGYENNDFKRMKGIYNVEYNKFSDKWFFTDNANILYYKGKAIFSKGVWAEIIEQPKETSKVPTSEEILKHFENAETVKCVNDGDIYYVDFNKILTIEERADGLSSIYLNDQIDIPFSGRPNECFLWHEQKGFAKIVDYKVKTKKPRPNRLEELEKRLHILELKVDSNKIAEMPENPYKSLFDTYPLKDIENGVVDTSWLGKEVHELKNPNFGIKVPEYLKHLENVKFGIDFGGDYHEILKPFDFNDPIPDYTKGGKFNSINNFLVDDQEYYKVISGGPGAFGADGEIGKIVKPTEQPKNYHGETFKNAKTIIKTISGEHWGLANGFKIKKATTDQINHAKTELAKSNLKKMSEAFKKIGETFSNVNPHSEVNKLKLRIEELEAENNKLKVDNEYLKGKNEHLRETISIINNFTNELFDK